MSRNRVEKFAREYLHDWHVNEEPGHRALNDTSLSLRERSAAIRKFANVYKIARNFHRKHEKVRYEHVISVFDKVKTPSKDANPRAVADAVNHIERKISARYGNRLVLSGVSKFLWLKFQRPFLIYDIRACQVLGIPTSSKKFLPDFYLAWHKAFNEHRAHIKEICARIDDATAQKLWFHERVLDIYMWRAGKLPPLSATTLNRRSV